jgi:hypothetical protein
MRDRGKKHINISACCSDALKSLFFAICAKEPTNQSGPDREEKAVDLP